jgi:hypothetical protein
MRTLSENIKAVLSSSYMETKDVVIITLPEQFDPISPEVTLYLANGAGIVIDGQVYSNKLRAISNLKFSLGSAPDNAEITIENVSRDLGFILTDRTKVFDGAKIIIKRAFKISENNWETVILFVGQIRNVKINEDSITLSSISDMSKRGTNMAQRSLTQKCIWVFNEYGSGIGPNCGWTTAQPGDPASCDHDLDSTNGCKAHGNQHRFGGVPAFTALTESNTGVGGGGGLPGGYDAPDPSNWGYGGGGGWCVHPNTWILCQNYKKERYWVQAFKVKENETLVTVDKFGKFLTTNVVKASKGTTTKLYTVTSERGFSISCSPSHPFITSLTDTEGTPCNLLKVGQKTLTSYKDSEKVIEDTITSIEQVETSCNVIMFQLEEPHHVYIGGSTVDGAFLFHNMKPMDTLDRMYSMPYNEMLI